MSSERDRRYRQGATYRAKTQDPAWRARRNEMAKLWRQTPKGKAFMAARAERRRQEKATRPGP